jgi:hypothetical protein
MIFTLFTETLSTQEVIRLIRSVICINLCTNYLSQTKMMYSYFSMKIRLIVIYSESMLQVLVGYIAFLFCKLYIYIFVACLEFK